MRTLASLLLLFSGAVPAQNTSQPANQNSSQNPSSRIDPNNPSSDLAGQGGPGFINNPANRPPYDIAENRISDKQFLERAVMRGLTQIELGKLAVQKASSPDLKMFGQKMMDDRTKLNTRLARLAGKEGLAVPGSLDGKHQARVDKLAKLSGEEFDKAYVKDQLNGQNRDAQAFLRESQEGEDAAIKAFALKVLPDVQKHYDTLKSLDKSKTAGK